MKTKIIFVLIDGLGDVGIADSFNKTPLQLAKTPNMDTIARMGLNGLLDPVSPGIACGSDTSHMSLFGYDPWKYYRGRGAFESMGAGIEMHPGDIAFKSNFATLDAERNIVISRRADREFEHEGPILCKYLNDTTIPEYPEYKVTVKYATEHRCGVCISGPNLTDYISGTDPLKDGLPLQESKPRIDSKDAIITSNIVNSLSRHFQSLLSQHSLNIFRKHNGKPVANVVLFRGCGARLKDIPTFEELYQMKSFMIAPTCMISGLGITIGMDIINVPGATGSYNSNWIAKGKTAIKILQDKDSKYTLGFVHIKAVDDAGHDGSKNKKIQCIEAIDLVLGEMFSIQSQPMIFIITSDHSTPIFRKDHSNEPVPFSIAYIDPRSEPPHSLVDSVDRFDEISASRGRLGRFSGNQVMPLVKVFTSIVSEYESK